MNRIVFVYFISIETFALILTGAFYKPSDLAVLFSDRFRRITNFIALYATPGSAFNQIFS